MVQAVVVALAEPTPPAGVQAASDPSPLPHCCWPEAGRFSSVASERDTSQSSDGLSEGYLRLLGSPRTNRGLSTSSPTVESGWCCPRGVRVTRP